MSRNETGAAVDMYSGHWKLWPWLTIAATALLALNPIGIDIIDAALFSREQLTRNIWQPILGLAVAILVTAGIAEFGIKWRLRHARARRAENPGRMES